MRDVTVQPFTVDEIIDALRVAGANATALKCEDDAYAIFLLRDFLDDPDLQVRLKIFLDKAQPKRKTPELEHLNGQQVKYLLETARGEVHTKGGWRAPSDLTVVSFGFKGISNRGSYVYDLNEGYNSSARLYVRVDPNDGLWRGEVNEDNFDLPRYVPEPQLNDEPVSATMGWWSKLIQTIKRDFL